MDSEYVNFNKALENDPEEVAKLHRLLDKSIRHRNTMSLRDFQQYEILFRKDGPDILGDAEYAELCNDYVSKISIYHPVYIVNEDHQVVMTLPAIFNKVNSISDMGLNGSQLVDAFSNAHMGGDDFDRRKQAYSAYMAKAFNMVQNKEAQQQNIQMNQELYRQATTRTVKKEYDPTLEVQDYIPEQIDKLDTGLSDEVEYL